MDCEQARAGLWPPEQPRLVGEDVAGARAHVRGCDACTEYFAQDRHLLDVYDRARKISAPMAVRERVFDAIAGVRWGGAPSEETTTPTPAASPEGDGASTAGDRSLLTNVRSHLVRFAGWPIAAAIALTVFLVHDEIGDRRAAVERSDVFVEDYLRRAVGEDHIESNDPTEVTRFLERELGMRIEPMKMAGFDLSRAEICLLEGRRGAMIIYQGAGDTRVSHYLVPRERAEKRAPALSTTEEGAPGDMPVVTWSTDAVEQALVGPVDPSVLLNLAESGASD